MNVSYDDQIKELQKQTERLKKKLDDTENTLIAIFEREESILRVSWNSFTGLEKNKVKQASSIS
jgi:hypothetical protein